VICTSTSSTAGEYSLSIIGTSGSFPHSSSVFLIVELSLYFRDNFTYGLTSQMPAIGWSTYGSQSVGGGTFTLTNDGSTGSTAYWTSVPSGVGNWTVSTRAKWAGGQYGTLHLEVYTTNHNYIWGVDGYLHQYILYRDGVYTAYSSNSLQTGIWHTLRMDMRQRVLSLYFDGNL